MKYKHRATGDVINDVTFESLSYIEQEEYDYQFEQDSLLDTIIEVGIAAVLLGDIGGNIDIPDDTIEFGGGEFGGAGAGGDW